MSDLITPVLDPRRDTNLLPGNKHHYANNRIVGADLLRVAMTLIVPAQEGNARTDLERSLRDEHRRPGRPYGIALLESQQLSVMLVTDPAEIQAFRTGQTGLNLGERATVYGGWPSCGHGPWEDIIPHTTWHPGGTGILDQYDGVDGATVSVFEYTIDAGLAWNSRGKPTGETTTMVSWHCDRCHTPGDFDLGEKWENRGPSDREWAGRNARIHARGRDEKCTVPTGEMERIVSRVASEMRGVKIDLPSPQAACAAEEGCGRVRQAKAVTARLLAAANGNDG